MLLFTIAATALVVGAHRLLEARVRALAERAPTISRGAVIAGAAATAVLLLIVFVAAGGPGRAGDEWDAFKSPDGLGAEEASRGAQIVDVSSRGRYEYWQEAVDAFDSEPLKGLGPGTYEFDLGPERHGRGSDLHPRRPFALPRDGCRARRPGLAPDRRIHGARPRAGDDWRLPPRPRGASGDRSRRRRLLGLRRRGGGRLGLELAAIAAALFLLAAVAVAGGREPAASFAPAAERPGLWPRLAIVAIALIVIAAVAIPLAGSTSVDRSRTAVAEGRLDDALDAADDAISIQPYAATPRLQAALVLERLGRFDEAASLATEATERESTNWRTWRHPLASRGARRERRGCRRRLSPGRDAVPTPDPAARGWIGGQERQVGQRGAIAARCGRSASACSRLPASTIAFSSESSPRTGIPGRQASIAACR